MNIVYFDKTDKDIPSDLIKVSEVSELTGYSRQSLLSSNLSSITIKNYCTIYRIKNKKTHCTFYSKSEVLEFLASDGREIANLFNSDKFYTYKAIATLYNTSRWHIYYLYFLIKKFKQTNLLEYLWDIRSYTFKNTHFFEKKGVEMLFKALGFTKKRNK